MTPKINYIYMYSKRFTTKELKQPYVVKLK